MLCARACVCVCAHACGVGGVVASNCVTEYSVEAGCTASSLLHSITLGTGALACSLCKLAGLIHAKMHIGASSILVKTEI